MDIGSYEQREKYMERQTNRFIDRQMDRKVDRQTPTNRQLDRDNAKMCRMKVSIRLKVKQIDRYTDKERQNNQTDKHTMLKCAKSVQQKTLEP